jgi:hypothetical protein
MILGKSTSWIAVIGTAKDATLNELSLVDTGEPSAPGASAMAIATRADGTLVIALDRFEHPMLHADSLAPLSSGATVIACTEMESTNASRACAYRDGAMLWRVSHVLDRGDNDLQVEGEPPGEINALRENAMQAHARDGHDAAMGIPAALAFIAAGFDDAAMRSESFTRLDNANAESFAGPVSRWQRIQRVQQAGTFEKLVPNSAKKIIARLSKPLAALGFAPVELPKPKKSDFTQQLAEFERVRDGFSQNVRIRSSGGNAFEVSFAVRHARVDEIVDRWMTQLGGREPAPYIFGLRALEGDRNAFYNLSTADDFAAFLDLIEARVPAWPDALADFKTLDARMQASYATRPLIEHELKRRASLIAGACLAGYNDIDELVASSTHTEMVLKQFKGIVDELRGASGRGG